MGKKWNKPWTSLTFSRKSTAGTTLLFSEQSKLSGKCAKERGQGSSRLGEGKSPLKRFYVFFFFSRQLLSTIRHPDFEPSVLSCIFACFALWLIHFCIMFIFVLFKLSWSVSSPSLSLDDNNADISIPFGHLTTFCAYNSNFGGSLLNAG